MNIGKALRTIRGARALSQKQLADLSGLDASYVSLIESGKRKPSLSTIQSLADKLEIPFYLFVLLGSDKKDLKGLSQEKADELGKTLLATLMDASSEMTRSG